MNDARNMLWLLYIGATLGSVLLAVGLYRVAQWMKRR